MALKLLKNFIYYFKFNCTCSFNIPVVFSFNILVGLIISLIISLLIIFVTFLVGALYKLVLYHIFVAFDNGLVIRTDCLLLSVCCFLAYTYILSLSAGKGYQYNFDKSFVCWLEF